MNPFNTEFYMWCDIGMFRNKDEAHLYKNFPCIRDVIRNRMYILCILPFQEGELSILYNGLTKKFDNSTHIGGGIIFGHKDIWTEWVRVYYDTLDKYMENDYFSGKDQSIMCSVYALHPELIALVYPTISYCNKFGFDGAWFFLRDFFAFQNRKKSRKK